MESVLKAPNILLKFFETIRWVLLSTDILDISLCFNLQTPVNIELRGNNIEVTSEKVSNDLA
jgi:hypothetical protein